MFLGELGLFSLVSQFLLVSGDVFDIPLNSHGYKLFWSPDYDSGWIKFEVHLTPALNKGDWFAIGFSNYGEFSFADYCLVLCDENRHNTIQDMWSDEESIQMDERSQDCEQFSWSTRYNRTRFSFVRKMDTCDGDDYLIEDGTTHVVWLRGSLDLTNDIEPDSISLGSAEERGMERVQLLKTILGQPIGREEAWSYVFHNSKLHVPTEETTYWCRVIRLPPELADKKHHVIQFESAIQPSSEGIVHHMELFHCIAPPQQDIPLYEGPCSSPEKPPIVESCKSVLAAWAMGALPFRYPKEAGRPIGGPASNSYVMLEVHYNNPEHIAGIIDSSGLRLQISKSLRRYDAGIMELGLEYTDKMAVPPRTNYFTLSGYCTSECTTVGLPSKGIKVFGSQLHTHLTGKRVYTRHIRNGRELAELNRDNHYSPHFQEIRLLKHPVTVLPGDALITTCVYNTQSRANITLGGFAITDEMCVNYIHYYPLVDLEVCKSSVSSDNLRTFFNYMHDWEGARTSQDKGISDNYHSIDWTPEKTRVLQEFFDQSTMSMQCNQSNGLKFPGDWENLPNTPVLYPLPPRPRYCSPK
ncbi:hypothetical protein M8J75_005848 [Diaphorina citri]|nr:hypothetical protein M8J75_005848 [Diaphorina citri]